MADEQGRSPGILGGRTKRRPYAILAPIAFCLPVLIAQAILHATGFSKSEIGWGLPFGMVVFSITVMVQLVATGILMVRRANDCGKDRGFVALLMIPLINVGAIIYLMFPVSKEDAIRH